VSSALERGVAKRWRYRQPKRESHRKRRPLWIWRGQEGQRPQAPYHHRHARLSWWARSFTPQTSRTGAASPRLLP